jgi:hypothetical protein
LLLLLL